MVNNHLDQPAGWSSPNYPTTSTSMAASSPRRSGGADIFGSPAAGAGSPMPREADAHHYQELPTIMPPLEIGAALGLRLELEARL